MGQPTECSLCAPDLARTLGGPSVRFSYSDRPPADADLSLGPRRPEWCECRFKSRTCNQRILRLIEARIPRVVA